MNLNNPIVCAAMKEEIVHSGLSGAIRGTRKDKGADEEDYRRQADHT